MGRRLILDTNVLIAYERGTIDRAALDKDELAIGAVSVAEYRVGIEWRTTPSVRLIVRGRWSLSPRRLSARLHRGDRRLPCAPDGARSPRGQAARRA